MTMRELYALELAELVRELEALEGFYIDQFYELSRGRFRIRLSKKGEKCNMLIAPPSSIHKMTEIEIREKAAPFSMAARKRISGARLKKVVQLAKDRIISFEMDRHGEQVNLILEMFGKGNLIITDGSMKIQLAYMVHDFKDRSVRPGKEYANPPSAALEPMEISADLLGERAVESKGSSLSNFVVRNVAIGKMYANEAIERCGIDPNVKVGGANMKELAESIRSVAMECMERPSFTIYSKDGNPVDFSICGISKYSGMERTGKASLQECLEAMESSVGAAPQENPEADAIEASMRKQRGILEGIDSEIEESRKAADAIMRNMHELNEIIIKARVSGAREKIESGGFEVMNINLKDKTIKVREKRVS